MREKVSRSVESHPDLDLIILDLAMPGMKGLQALTEFGRKRPDLPVIVLSSSEDPETSDRRWPPVLWVMSPNPRANRCCSRRFDLS